jgi:hypothetical protein
LRCYTELMKWKTKEYEREAAIAFFDAFVKKD